STTLSSHSSEISALSDEIQLKVSNQTYQQDKTNLENRLTTAEGSITTLAGQIALKANKTDVYTKTQVDQELGKKVDTTVYNQKIGELTTSINGISANVSNLQTTVGQHGTSISNLQSQVDIHAGQIASKVDAEYVQNAIDGIKVGGRNLIPDSNNFTKFATATYRGSTVEIIENVEVPEWGAEDATKLILFGGESTLKATPSIYAMRGTTVTYSFWFKNVGDTDVRLRFNGLTVTKINRDYIFKPGESERVIVTGLLRPDYDWFQHQIHVDEGERGE